MEVREPRAIAELCSALAHPNRVHLYQLLQANNEVYLADLVTLATQSLPKPLNYMTVKHHVQTMVDAGVVHLGKRNGQFFVTLTRPNIQILEVPGPAPRVGLQQ